MKRIERSVEIEVAPERVFDALVRWDGLTRWSTMTVSHTGPGSCTGLGDTFEQTIRVAGVDLQTEWRVTEYQPPRAIAYHATGPGGSSMTMRQRVTGMPSGSRLDVEVDYELPGGVLGDVADLVYVHRRSEREAEHTLGNLKELLESQA